jgi:hypothetical protein
MPNNPELLPLFDFLKNFAPRVTGRSATIDDDLENTVRLFAAGELDREQLAAAAAEILQSESAINLLASQLGATGAST